MHRIESCVANWKKKGWCSYLLPLATAPIHFMSDQPSLGRLVLKERAQSKGLRYHIFSAKVVPGRTDKTFFPSFIFLKFIFSLRSRPQCLFTLLPHKHSFFFGLTTQDNCRAGV
jgi:hypothetical protein